MQLALRVSIFLVGCIGMTVALDNGMALTPPMGWRSWNLYGGNVSQKLIEDMMEGLVSRKRMVDGKPTSLCDLGYCDIGLDDNWQICRSRRKKRFRYHTFDGHPRVDLVRFPNLKSMVNKAHKYGLTAGFYLNNCLCKEEYCGSGVRFGEEDTKCYRGDVSLVHHAGFDSVKIDGCGTQYDLNLWNNLLQTEGHKITIEACHWGKTIPTKEWCPFHYYRTFWDVRANYAAILTNMRENLPFLHQGLSRPGCWAYPDMLEVGVQYGPGGNRWDSGLSIPETRSHFAAWAIMSSPLILSHDLLNDKVMDKIWGLIANPDAIMVNQAWHVSSGGRFYASESTAMFVTQPTPEQGNVTEVIETFPAHQYLYKPINATTTAVVLLNSNSEKQQLSLPFSTIPANPCRETHNCHVYDIWNRKYRGSFHERVSFEVKAHDAVFALVFAKEEKPTCSTCE